MTFDPLIHHRRSIRLRGYDYAGGGAYFITICTQNKRFLFGEIVEDEMILTEEGRIVQRIWHTFAKDIPRSGARCVSGDAQPFARNICFARTGVVRGLGPGHRNARYSAHPR
jgi:hypothetical protein